MITATDVLKLLVRTAQHFLKFAWEMLGDKKKIVTEKE